MSDGGVRSGLMTKEAGVSETVDEGNPSPVKIINNTVNQSVITTLSRS